ncbi:putative minus-end-directed kinesin ATPase [Helianthus anomalus]
MVGPVAKTSRQVLSVVNGGQDTVMRVGPASIASSDCGGIEFTREDVEALLSERIKPKNKFSLKPCLGGDSKTLMVVNVSPAPSSINESLCSLRFAARVNACEIGTPRRQTSVKQYG